VNSVRGIQAVVTDIEGTTSSLAFVKETLFPYARLHLADYVRTHALELGDIPAQIRAEVGRECLTMDEMIVVLSRWMDEDRKITPLKTLQGLIWRSGYERGELLGHVYEDAARALRAWYADGIRVYIYSSGSIDAQKLLFEHSSMGDMTPLIAGYFDTTTGPKSEPRSYEKISRAIGLPPHSILFLSDHPAETAAALAAGFRTIRVDREQHADAPVAAAATTFDDIEVGP